MKQLFLKRAFKKIIPAIVSILILYSCDHSSRKPGYSYVDDMMVSDAYETYTTNSNFKDNKTAQPSILGTIPRETIPYHYAKTPEGMQKASLELKNPFTGAKDSIKILERGHKMFDVFCAICHGSKGEGKGLLYSSGKYPTEPASLISKDFWERPDGEIYHVITVGSIIMAAHADHIRIDDRWKIILYIKNVLQPNEKVRLAKESQIKAKKDKKF
ncbi:MAG: hypothetical protein CO118_05715 [Flavobacteriales bacterium CG_4_9_14_3_um_filter_32_8]|nr:MAG: hypothetical protein CO118_05715 [Flavobacteriales bacterium CG_4_9_14_3_um_filter_32_8]